MNRFLFFPFILLFLSCSNSDDDNPIDPVDPVENNTFVYAHTYELMDVKHFVGPDGKELEESGTTFLEKEWSYYEDPGVLEINFKEDSILITTESTEYSYKYKVENNDLFIYQEDKKKLVGQVQEDSKQLSLFKKYLTYQIITDKDNNEVVYEKSNGFGTITNENIFPVVIGSPSDLVMEEEYIFWSNISYQFIPKQ